ncbi:MAG: tRNA lysidine(34) synthetase, partial [Eubacteriales bacterium]|nr:tRNA lysidine(34) synthetase [Eubacteriales bacterium]
MEDFFEKLYAVVVHSHLKCGKPKAILAAVSGGADSVALLLLLNEMRKRENVTLLCCHVHHGLRESADFDAQFVQQVCKSLSIPFIQKNVSIQGKSNIEAKAREKRYSALKTVCLEQNMDLIATA